MYSLHFLCHVHISTKTIFLWSVFDTLLEFSVTSAGVCSSSKSTSEPRKMYQTSPGASTARANYCKSLQELTLEVSLSAYPSKHLFHSWLSCSLENWWITVCFLSVHEWKGLGWYGLGWTGMDWDGMGWTGMGWDVTKWVIPKNAGPEGVCSFKC